MPNRAAPHIELRVVRLDGSGPDDYGVHMGAQQMKMVERRFTIDIAGFAADRRDAPIERLPQLSHHERPAGISLQQGGQNLRLFRIQSRTHISLPEA